MSDIKNKPKIKLKWVVLAILLTIIISVATFAGITYFSYRNDIAQTNPSGETKTIEVVSGDTIDTVSTKLADENLLASKSSIKMYASINKKTRILAGTYKISPSMTIPQIVDILVSGQEKETLTITFLPGGTVSMAKKVLLDSGFSNGDIEEAFSKDYRAEFPQLFADKPADTDLEGYMFGETYHFNLDTKADTVLRRAFAEMQKYVISLGLESKFNEQGLSLYEGITLASIIQREVTGLDDQKEVAAVFYNRMRAGMTLGSDVTYQYIADKLGIERDYNLDSPYNLRLYAGLTPTPISTPGVSALTAASNPGVNDYLYFLSGDDGKTYFGSTNVEHEQNIVDHCQEKCKII